MKDIKGYLTMEQVEATIESPQRAMQGGVK